MFGLFGESTSSETGPSGEETAGSSTRTDASPADHGDRVTVTTTTSNAPVRAAPPMNSEEMHVESLIQPSFYGTVKHPTTIPRSLPAVAPRSQFTSTTNGAVSQSQASTSVMVNTSPAAAAGLRKTSTPSGGGINPLTASSSSSTSKKATRLSGAASATTANKSSPIVAHGYAGKRITHRSALPEKRVMPARVRRVTSLLGGGSVEEDAQQRLGQCDVFVWL